MFSKKKGTCTRAGNLKKRYNIILAKQTEVDSEQDTVATREELILDVCSSIGEAKEKCMASMPNNEDEGDILNESAIEQHFDVQDESVNSDHPDVQIGDSQNAIETVDGAQVITWKVYKC